MIEQSEGRGYVAVCSTLGAVLQGATIDGARANIAEAIELAIEDMRASGETIPAIGG
ncbi:MAG: HicB like antitoxin of bacterial toxin-antitoxin system [Thermoleophilia bacterium]|nr:HicB like antitoxin of bacterial toxin-antitoxin system [Thermoleophilia bacterium]